MKEELTNKFLTNMEESESRIMSKINTDSLKALERKVSNLESSLKDEVASMEKLIDQKYNELSKRIEKLPSTPAVS